MKNYLILSIPFFVGTVIFLMLCKLADSLMAVV